MAESDEHDLFHHSAYCLHSSVASDDTLQPATPGDFQDKLEAMQWVAAAAAVGIGQLVCYIQKVYCAAELPTLCLQGVSCVTALTGDIAQSCFLEGGFAKAPAIIDTNMAITRTADMRTKHPNSRTKMNSKGCLKCL